MKTTGLDNFNGRGYSEQDVMHAAVNIAKQDKDFKDKLIAALEAMKPAEQSMKLRRSPIKHTVYY